ncbi:MAG: M28 family peptidase [Lentisphaeria bacterium]|nr:M28 family peptidase [Lentisphaeria bacterium]
MEKHQPDLDVLREFLALPHRAECVLDKFAGSPGIRKSGGGKKNFVYIPGTREKSVLLVAHADTVGEENTEVVLAEDERTIRNERGILGADDRAGCAMLWLLRDSGHGLLVTDGEETGCIGSKFLKYGNPDLFDEINGRYRFMVQIDRCGGNEFKCYGVGTEEFRSYIEAATSFSEPDRTRSTDIVQLCRDICGVNLSCGYHLEHTEAEYLVKEQWLHTLEMLRTWLSRDDLPAFRLK